jgi:hypothetical protein
MAAKFVLQVLTANRLADGEAVWWSADHRWSESLAGAEIAHDADAATGLEAIGKAAYAANLVVDVNLIDVELADGVIVPLRLREKIRAAGPTIRPDLGKQARPAAARAA